MNVPVSEGLQKLTAAGFKAVRDDNIRDLAVQRDMTPMEVATIIRGEAGNATERN